MNLRKSMANAPRSVHSLTSVLCSPLARPMLRTELASGLRSCFLQLYICSPQLSWLQLIRRPSRNRHPEVSWLMRVQWFVSLWSATAGKVWGVLVIWTLLGHLLWRLKGIPRRMSPGLMDSSKMSAGRWTLVWSSSSSRYTVFPTEALAAFSPTKLVQWPRKAYLMIFYQISMLYLSS